MMQTLGEFDQAANSGTVVTSRMSPESGRSTVERRAVLSQSSSLGSTDRTSTAPHRQGSIQLGGKAATVNGAACPDTPARRDLHSEFSACDPASALTEDRPSVLKGCTNQQHSVRADAAEREAAAAKMLTTQAEQETMLAKEEARELAGRNKELVARLDATLREKRGLERQLAEVLASLGLAEERATLAEERASLAEGRASLAEVQSAQAVALHVEEQEQHSLTRMRLSNAQARLTDVLLTLGAAAHAVAEHRALSPALEFEVTTLEELVVSQGDARTDNKALCFFLDGVEAAAGGSLRALCEMAVHRTLIPGGVVPASARLQQQALEAAYSSLTVLMEHSGLPARANQYGTSAPYPVMHFLNAWHRHFTPFVLGNKVKAEKAEDIRTSCIATVTAQ